MTELPASLVVLGVGGNIGSEGEIVERFVRAREAFSRYGVVRSAALYRTAPIGPAQSDFLNTAISVRFDDGQPDELIAAIREIEMLLGRDRRGEARWGPRRIDLDVLLWGTRTFDRPDLEIPHPRLAERRFALQPLVDLVSADVVLPGTRTTLGELLARVALQPLALVATTW